MYEPTFREAPVAALVARKFLEEQEGEGWVFKADGNKEGVKTFVAESPEQMMAMLDHYIDLSGGKIPCVLQKVVDGVEIKADTFYTVKNGEWVEVPA